MNNNNITEKMNIISLKSVNDEDDNDFSSPKKNTGPLKKGKSSFI
jgi:hypothetical protein